MQPMSVTVGPIAAASANNICLSQTPSAGALLINGALASGGVATLDVQRRVLITTTADESARTFTITGTNWSGSVISQTITGPNATTGATTISFKTVTSVTISGNAAGALTVGTNGIADSPWVRFDDFAPNYATVTCTISGTVNWTVQWTLDDPNDPQSPVAAGSMTFQNATDTNLVNQAVANRGGLQYAPTFARVVLNSGTGSVRGTFLQSSNGPI
jgi:hypothetical protein